ncbi:MAG: hypothetical protein LW807_07585 [Proteobacteria bacterium]|jgi:DNA-binding response OmpR family regulator|nr:hypothetical protein [Pseudomonadota bacterium]
MEKKLVATHKYKTRVVFLDDNIDFLECLRDNMPSAKYECLFVNNLNDFTHLISESKLLKNTLPNILESLDIEISDLNYSEALYFDLSQFKNTKILSEKEQEISVIVVDNNLGNLNGISICANVEDKTIAFQVIK